MIQGIQANMSAATLCMNLIEFLGGINNGELGKERKVQSRFRSGIQLLGNQYVALGLGNMYALWNSLIHQYVAKMKDFREVWIINDWPKIFWYMSDGNEDDEIWPPVRMVNGDIVKDSIMIEGDTIWFNVVALTKDISQA
jgi:hypothetical protein